MEIELHQVGKLIAECWTNAEAQTALAIKQKYANPDEENVTFLFRGELKAEVEAQSNNRRFAHALRADLSSILSGVDVDRLARGLVARVNFHTRHHEGSQSGADLGLLVARPSFNRVGEQLFIQRSIHQGLLAQAKLNQRNTTSSRWGALTKKQRAMIAELGSCFALLLYEVQGDSRCQLEPFRWQICGSYPIELVISWLKQGKFPDPMQSSSVIRQLSLGRLGTRDPNVIKRLIDPLSTNGSVIEIEVHWPAGKGPSEGSSAVINSPRRERVAQTA